MTLPLLPTRNGLRVALRAASLAFGAFAAIEGAAQSGTPAPTDAIYKCRGERGVPVYQEAPCESGASLRDFTADPANVSVIPFRQVSPAPPDRPPAKRAERRTTAAAAKSGSGQATGKAEERRYVREGMSDAEVRAKLGPPDMSSGAGGKMRWSYLPATGDPATVTTIRFANGKVVGVERSVVR